VMIGTLKLIGDFAVLGCQCAPGSVDPVHADDIVSAAIAVRCWL
jgi:hypothetical protein